MAIFKVDTVHSEITFKVKHLMISSASGKFTKFDATMKSDREDLSDAVVTFEADVDSITTGNEQRDMHLKSDDFFNAEKYPKLKFKSTGLKKVSDDEYKLMGDLTVRDITKSVVLNVIYNGTIVDPWGNSRAGFEVDGKINRHDFGLKWNAVTETGGLVVGADVKIHTNIELIKQEVLVEQEA